MEAARYGPRCAARSRTIGTDDLKDYYARRAPDYDRIYLKPERQEDLALMRRTIPELLAGRDVLEVACGTGYWTEVIAPTARSLVATDVGEEVLALARARTYPAGRVRFERADAFDPGPVAGTFNAAFAGFWWSHIPKGRIDTFLRALHARLEPGSRAVFIDNRYVAESSTPVSRTDAEGNAYQLRRLGDGSEHEVLKNFPSQDDLRAAVRGLATDVAVIERTYYWLLCYSLA